MTEGLSVALRCRTGRRLPAAPLLIPDLQTGAWHYPNVGARPVYCLYLHLAI